MNKSLRLNGRNHDEFRPISISYNVFGDAHGSVLFELGNTKVLCTVSLQQGVPPFLKGSKSGWLTAEYALLPTATQMRTQRDAFGQKLNGRSIEIARFISRSLRTMVNLSALGERTIIVDCDVLQADGGTRTACITAAALALKSAQTKWIMLGICDAVLIDDIAAVSAGMQGDQPLLDIDYQEDATIDCDYNFVLSRSGDIIEIQGAAEKRKMSWQSFDQLCLLVRRSMSLLFATLDTFQDTRYTQSPEQSEKSPLFSLKHRLKQTRNDKS